MHTHLCTLYVLLSFVRQQLPHTNDGQRCEITNSLFQAASTLQKWLKWNELKSKGSHSHSFCAEHVYAIKQNKQHLKQIELKIADSSRCIYTLASVRFDWTAFSVISIQFHFIISSRTSNYSLYNLTGALDCPWCPEFSTVFFKMLFY